MRTIKRSTSALAAARARFGLTQEQMAKQLGISTSMVKMVETNKRFLSTDKLVILASLEITLATIHKTDSRTIPASARQLHDFTSNAHALETRYQETRCNHMATRMERKLAKMKMEYAKLTASIHNLDAIEKIKLDMSDQLVKGMLLVRPKLLKKLSICSLPVQALLHRKIVLLRAEAALNKSIQPRYVHTNEKPILSPLKQSNMDYTVLLINNRPDCQAMIDKANDDKESLVYRHTGLQRQQQNASVTTASIDTDLASVTAELSALQTIFDGMPDGDTKEETRVKIKKAEYKKFLLEQRKANYGSLSLIEKEYDIACVEQSIVETEAFIVALTTRMNELPPA